MDKSYSVDDILLELEIRKGMAAKKPVTAQAEKEVHTTEIPAVKPKEPKAPATPAPQAEEPMKVAPAKKDASRKAPAKAEENTTEIPKITAFPSPAKPAQASQQTRPIAVQPKKPVTQNTVAINTHTRVLTVDNTKEKYHTMEVPVATQLDGQLVMEQFAEVVDKEAEEELRRRRRNKVDAFRLVESKPDAFKLRGEEEENDLEEIVETRDESDDVLEDFGDYTEAETIASEIAYRRRTGAIGVAAGVIITLVLSLLTVLYSLGWLRFVPAPLLVSLHLALLLGMLFISHSMMSGGLKSLLKLRPDADAPPALCGVIGLVYTAVQYADLAAVTNGSALFLSAAAALAVLGGTLGRQMQIMRISRNFKYISVEKNRKFAAHYVDEEKPAAELGHPVGMDGIPPMLYYRRASFLTRFLEISYGGDPADRVMRWYVPVVLGVCALCGGGYALLFPQYAWKGLTVFAAAAMVSLPSWSMFATQRALSRSCKKALRKNVFIGGWHAAEQFGEQMDMVITEARELFPTDQVKLHGIKTFSGTRIDEAITDAASVAIASGGPLAPIFRRLIEHRIDILGEVDTLAYEQDMGVSGWVSGRRTLIGNRRLMENHGIAVPTREYEEKYLKDDRCIVYLSTGGELAAMFVVSYLAHPDIKAQVKALYKEHGRLLVRTVDPNVTAALIARVTDIPEDGVIMLNAAQGRAYGALLQSDEHDRTDAVLACGGRAQSKLFGAVQCRRLRRGGKAAVLSQLLPSALLLGFSAFVTATTGIIFRGDTMLALLAGYAFLGWLLPKFFKC